MRTESSASARLRSEWARARRWLDDRSRGRGRLARIVPAAAVAIALAAVAIRFVPTDPAGMVWLYDGRRFSADGARALQQALAAERIDFAADREGRVGVAPAQWSNALAAAEKHHAEPLSISALEVTPPSSSLWDLPGDRASRDDHQIERELRAYIERYPDIREATVRVIRSPSARLGMTTAALAAVPKVHAIVLLDVDRRPPAKILSAIQTLVSLRVPGMASDDVTIAARSGEFYVSKGDPKGTSSTRALAREEELHDTLMDHLRSIIPGVDLLVRVEPNLPAPASAPTPTPAQAPPPRPIAVPASEEVVRPNRPLGAPPSEPPDEIPAATPAPALAPAEVAPTATPGVGRADIWVKVPSRYYRDIFRENNPNRRPSAEDLEPYYHKTRELIARAVEMTIPTAERGKVQVDTIFDDASSGAGPLGVAAGSAETSGAWPAWATPAALGAAGGLGLALVLGTGVGVMAARRPAGRPARDPIRPGLAVDAPAGPVPAPSERVREFVRRDPEAAAGVLQRWIGQGRGEGGPHP